MIIVKSEVLSDTRKRNVLPVGGEGGMIKTSTIRIFTCTITLILLIREIEVSAFP